MVNESEKENNDMSNVETKTNTKTSTKVSAKASAKSKSKPSNITPEQLAHMIAEAAYYQAEKRGFLGDPQQDWLAAEKEINQRLAETQNLLRAN
jgi:hypothetical protein